MTYEQWLEHWRENYGDATVGEYGYWRQGKHHSITVHRLTEAEFTEHDNAIALAYLKADDYASIGNYDAVEAALASAFPHELALVF